LTGSGPQAAPLVYDLNLVFDYGPLALHFTNPPGAAGKKRFKARIRQ